MTRVASGYFAEGEKGFLHDGHIAYLSDIDVVLVDCDKNFRKKYGSTFDREKIAETISAYFPAKMVILQKEETWKTLSMLRNCIFVKSGDRPLGSLPKEEQRLIDDGVIGFEFKNLPKVDSAKNYIA